MSITDIVVRNIAQEAALAQSSQHLGPVPFGPLPRVGARAYPTPELKAQAEQAALTQTFATADGSTTTLTADRFVIGGPGVPSILQTVSSPSVQTIPVEPPASAVAAPLPSPAERAASLNTRFAEARSQMEAARQAASLVPNQTETVKLYDRLLNDPSRQFLDFDPTGDGRIVEVFGDITTADNVGVLIPGIENRLDNFQGFSDAASRAHAEANLTLPAGQSTAVIAWLGYDTPNLSTAPFDNTAQTAGPLLKNFVEGLQLPDSVHTSLFPHSYGTLVGGESLRLGLDVDLVGLLGSAGTGVDHRDQLGVSENTGVYVFRTMFDQVSYSENFGLDPSDHRFGAVRVETGDVVGHGSYFEADSISLTNIARLLNGDIQQVSTVEPTALEVAAGVADDGIKILLTPLTEALEGAAAITGDSDVVEGANRVVNFARRLVSPDFWVDVGSDLVEAGSQFISSAADTVGNFVGNVVDASSPVINAVSDFGGSVVDTVGNFASDAVDATGNFLNTAADFGAGVVNTAIDVGSTIATGVGNVATAIGNGISTAYNATVNFFSGLFN